MALGNCPRSPLHPLSRYTGMMVLLILFQTGCHSGKYRTATPPLHPAPIRIAFLPLDIPEGGKDQEWIALAIPVLMAEIAENAIDLDVVPLWESMPLALEAAGGSRIIDAESASSVAAHLASEWATHGKLSRVRNTISLTVDFIPANYHSIPFRYMGLLKADSMQPSLIEAVNQFLRYQRAKALNHNKGTAFSAGNLREIAEAVDHEYGWFSAVQPAAAGQMVETLSSRDNRLARLVFNPAIYPQINPGPTLSATHPDLSETQPETSAMAKTIAPPPSLSEAASGPDLLSNHAQLTERAREESPEQAPSESMRPPEPPEVVTRLQPESAPQKTGASSSASTSANTAVANPASPPPASAMTSTVEPKISPPSSIENKELTAPTTADYVIQVYASRDRKSAEAEAARLQNTGLTVRMEEEDLKENGTWYRIRLHGYPSLASAESAAAELKAEGRIKQSWITSQADFVIQVYSSQVRLNAEAVAARLEKAGLAVEIEEKQLGEEDTWYRVRLHGYRSLVAAKSAADQLQAEGIIQQYWIAD